MKEKSRMVNFPKNTVKLSNNRFDLLDYEYNFVPFLKILCL